MQTLRKLQWCRVCSSASEIREVQATRYEEVKKLELAMPKMIVSLDGIVIKDVTLTKNRTTLGRRPYNDIVIDNLAVSGEHAVIQMTGGQVYIEDLNSTNGTNLNGKAVKRELLRNNDTIEVGKYKIKFFSDTVGDDYEKTMIYRSPTTSPVPLSGSGRADFRVQAAGPMSVPAALPDFDGDALIRVISGAAAGREVPLTKIVTTIGKIGVSVAAITKRRHGYVVAHVEGVSRLLLNGAPLGPDPVPLRDKDMLELAGTGMQFLHV